MGICSYSSNKRDKDKNQYFNINNIKIDNIGSYNVIISKDPSDIGRNRFEKRINNLNTGCCCPSCGEPAGNHFFGSGDKSEYFDCLKCGQYQNGKSYYICKTCNAIFCSKCPHNNSEIGYFCPSCGEQAGNNFHGSGHNTEYFDCLKCGQHQNGKTYFQCDLCKGIFCYRCPQKKTHINNYNYNKNNLINTSCPACGEPAGKNFKGNGWEYFNCLKCGEKQNGKNCYKCKICKGIFCFNCPNQKYSNFAKCPSCGEPAGKNFSGNGWEYSNCLKCGEAQHGKNCFKCKECKGKFCYKCPYN